MIWPIISKDSFISYNSMSNFYAPAIPTVPLIPLSLCIGTASLERPIYNNFIYLFLAMLGLRGSMGFSLVVGSRGYSLVTACGLLIVVASLAVEDMLYSVQAQQLRFLGSRVQARVMAHGLCCSTACEIFPDQGSILCFLYWSADFCFYH